MPSKGKPGWKFRWTEDRVITMLRIYSQNRRDGDPQEFMDFIGKPVEEKIELYKSYVRKDIFP